MFEKMCITCKYFNPIDLDWQIGRCENPNGAFRPHVFGDTDCHCWVARDMKEKDL